MRRDGPADKSAHGFPARQQLSHRDSDAQCTACNPAANPQPHGPPRCSVSGHKMKWAWPLASHLHVKPRHMPYAHRHMPTIERYLQRVLNKLQVWADENGFKFSTSKTVVMHFCKKKKEHSHPELVLNGTALPVVEETKFLGLIFDSKLTFIPHLKYLRKKCLQAINLLRIVGHYDWGADSTTLLKLYDSTIRS